MNMEVLLRRRGQDQRNDEVSGRRLPQPLRGLSERTASGTFGPSAIRLGRRTLEENEQRFEVIVGILS